MRSDPMCGGRGWGSHLTYGRKIMPKKKEEKKMKYNPPKQVVENTQIKKKKSNGTYNVVQCKFLM